MSLGPREVSEVVREQRWSARIIIRYTILQLPALALFFLALLLSSRWIGIPLWSFWGLVALWVAKDVILFPFVWRAYDDRERKSADAMIGMRGIAQDRLAPDGYVQVRGELWRAELMGGGPPVEKGAAVKVRKTRGLTLIVQPSGDEKRESMG
jgi:membrane protein implicated in regulation of membrane protease activity